MRNKDGSIPKHIYNWLVWLFIDEGFQKLISDERKRFEKTSNTNAIVECRRSIKNFLYKKKMPLSWLEPIFTYIRKDEIDFPDDTGISLRVAGQELTDKNPEAILVTTKDGIPLYEKSISIVITAKTSIDRLKKFIEENKRDITSFQDQLGLPEDRRFNWKEVDLALKVIAMKDGKGMTFLEISHKLTEDENLPREVYDILSSPDNLKTIYHRYKRRLSL